MLHRVYTGRQNTIEVIIFRDAVYIGCRTVRQIPDRKLLLLLHSIYDVLTQISNDFQRSLYRVQCRQTLAVAVWRVWCNSPIEKKQSNLGVRSQAFRSLSSLQRWKTDAIFTRVLLLALYSSADVFLFCFLFTISIFLSLGSAVFLNTLSSIS